MTSTFPPREPVTTKTTETAVPSLASAPPLPAAITAELAASAPPSEAALDEIYTLEHHVPIGPGRTIHLIETLSARAARRAPRRALLMLPGPMTPGTMFKVPVEGYDDGRALARAGFFAFAADFEGTGKSTYPDDGRSPSLEQQVEAMGKVVAYIQALRQVPRVDVLGESWGGGVAVELAADEARVRSCIAATMVYREPPPLVYAAFLNDGFKAMLDSLPGGYFPTPPEMYGSLVINAPDAVKAWAFATLPGRYASAPFHDLFKLPYYRPERCRVPCLIIQGEQDPMNSLDDARALAAAFGGGGARLVVVPGGAHIPRLEQDNRQVFMAALLEFLKD